MRHNNSCVRDRLGKAHILDSRSLKNTQTMLLVNSLPPVETCPRGPKVWGLPKSCSFHPGSSLENNPYGKSNPEVLTYFGTSCKEDTNPTLKCVAYICEDMEKQNKRKVLSAEWTTAQDQEPKWNGNRVQASLPVGGFLMCRFLKWYQSQFPLSDCPGTPGLTCLGQSSESSI